MILFREDLIAQSNWMLTAETNFQTYVQNFKKLKFCKAFQLTNVNEAVIWVDSQMITKSYA